jgi:hypothetical protein
MTLTSMEHCESGVILFVKERMSWKTMLCQAPNLRPELVTCDCNERLAVLEILQLRR